MIRRSHRGFDKSSARSVRIREKAAQLRSRVKQSTQLFLKRHHERISWWSKTFRAPQLGYQWLVGQAKTFCAALMAMLGIAPSRKFAWFSSSPRTRASASRPTVIRKLAYAEGLEQRQLMAADLYVDAPLDYVLQVDADTSFNVSNGDTVQWVGANGIQNDIDDVAGLPYGARIETSPGVFKGAFGSIQDAITAAQPGDTIRIAPGVYAENLTISKSVTILGPNAGTPGTATRLNPEASITGWVQIAAPGAVVIDGLEFRPAAATTGSPDGVNSVLNIGNGNNHEVKNNLFYSSHAGGFTGSITPPLPSIDLRAIMMPVIGSGSVTISGNAITGNGLPSDKYGTARWGRGLWTDGGGVSVDVSNNSFFSARTGMNLDGNSPFTLASNSIQTAGTGISVGAVLTSLSLTGNQFTNVDSDVNGRNVAAGNTLDLSGISAGVSETFNILGGNGADNIKGTPSADVFDASNLSSGSENDRFEGAGGNDIYLGKGGFDRAVFSGNRADYTVTISGSTVTVLDNRPLSPDGQDTLTDVEILEFDDVSVHLVGVGSYTTIQTAVNNAASGDVVFIPSGTYNQDVLIANSGVILEGQSPATTTVVGQIGGNTAAIRIAANNVTVRNLTITRVGNTVADWNNPSLKLAGLAIQGAFTGALISGNVISGNRTGIDINNSSSHTISQNVIENNHTGLIFRNQTDNLTVSNNTVTNNRTVGVLFLDQSSGTNTPLQQAANSNFTDNNISGNWYGQIVDRQAGGSLPSPGSNVKNFSGNWFGSANPVVSTANSSEPSYTALIPVAFGGSAVPPSIAPPDILGPASLNFDITPLLQTGIDTSVLPGFQGDFSSLRVVETGSQSGPTGRIQEGYNLISSTGGDLLVASGTYTGNVASTATAVTREVDLALGGSPGQVVVNGNLGLTSGDTVEIEILGTNPVTQFDNFVVNGTVNLGNATLAVDPLAALVPYGTYTIVDNDSNDPVAGTFAGLPEGALVGNFSGIDLRITYAGGSGNDVVLYSVVPVQVNTVGGSNTVENNNGFFVVELPSPAPYPITVYYSLSGTATQPNDFFVSTPGTLVIPAGQTVANINIAAALDGVLEVTETVILTLTGTNQPAVSIGPSNTDEILIFDGDSGLVRTSVLDGSISEVGDNAGVFLLRLTDNLNNPLTIGPSLNATVTFALTGTATASLDYLPVITTAVIPSGSSAVPVTITAINDLINFDNGETVVLSITGVTSAHPSLTFSNVPSTLTISDPVRPIATISPVSTTVNEGSNAQFQVSLSSAATDNVTLALNYSGTASTPADFSAQSSVVIPAGSSTAIVSLPTVNDLLTEGSETLGVSLSYLSGNVALTGGIANATIADANASTLTVTAGSVTEGSNSNLTFGVTFPAAVNRTFQFARVASSSAETIDYSLSATTVVIPAGSTTATVPVSALTDNLVEGSEQLLISLTSQTGGPATSLSAALGTLTIQDANTSTYNVSSGTFGEGAGNGTFVISLTTPFEHPVTFTYGIGSGSALGGAVDYVASTSGTVVVPASSTSVAVTVALVDDNIIEPDETLGLSITGANPMSGTIAAGTTSATMTIDDNDTATLSLLAPVTTLSEATAPSPENLLLVMTNPSSQPVTVTLGLSGSATVNDDYTLTPLVYVIPANQQLLSIPVSALNDSLVEGNETLAISIADIASAVQPGSSFTPGSAATLTIVDNDSASVTIGTPVSEPEGTGAGTTNVTIPVTMSAPSSQVVTLTYSTGTGTASGSDFTSATLQTVTFAVNTTSTSIVVPITRDSIVEADETFTVTLNGVSSVAPSISLSSQFVSTVTIEDDDSATLSVGNPAVTLTEGGATQTLTVNLTNQASTATVYSYSLNFGGTAVASDVASSLTGTINIAAGQTQGFIPLSAFDDTTVEASETFTIALAKVSGDDQIGPASIASAATVTILDNDSTTVSLGGASGLITEGTGTNTVYNFTVSLSQAAAVDTVFTLTRNNGTPAVNFSTDITGLSASTPITIAAGDTIATVPFTVVADSMDEANELFSTTLSLGSNSASVVLGAVSTRTVTIGDDDNAAVTISGATSVTEGGVAALTISSTASQNDLTVTYVTVGGSASTLDYTSVSSSVVIPASAAGNSVVINVPTTPDTLVEANETFSVSLSNVSGSPSSPTLGSPTVRSITIFDNDSTTLSVSPGPTASEGSGTATFTLALSSPAQQDVTIVYQTVNGTAVAGSDFTSVSGTTVIPALSSSVTIPVSILNDNTVESQETFSLSLSSATSNLASLVVGTSVAVATITDNDSAIATIQPIINAEETSVGAFGNAGGFLVSLSNPVDVPVTVNFSVGGTASNGIDYAAVSPSVVIPTGQTTAVVVVNPVNELLVEGNESVILALTSTSQPSVTWSATPATISVIDNDSSTLSISGSPTSETTGSAEFTFSLSQPSATPTSVTYSLGGSTATNGSDYTGATSGVIVFAPSVTAQTLSLTVIDDLLVEGTETLAVSVTSIDGSVSGAGANSTIAIADNDAAQVNIIQLTPSISESGGNAQYLVYLNSLAQNDVTATIALGGTATAGSDYNASSTTVVIPGGSLSANFSVPLINDNVVESTESLIASITGASGSGTITVGPASAATVSILNEDSATINIDSATAVSENLGTALVQVTLSAPSDSPTVVSYSLVNGSASSTIDFINAVGAVTFNPMQTVAAVSVSIVNDNVVELNETFSVSLGTPSGNPAIALGSSNGNVTITNDDSASVTIGTSVSISEGSANVSIPITMSAPASHTVTLTYSTGTGSASASDFTSATSQTVTFGVGSTSTNIVVPITNDTIVENDETFSVTLNAVASTLVPAVSLSSQTVSTVTILDNDAASISLSNVSQTVTEGQTATLTLSLSAASATETVVSYSFVPGSAVAADVTSTSLAPLNGLVTIAANATQATFSLVTNDDNIVEMLESFTVGLSKVSGDPSISLGTATGTVSIQDNDTSLLRVFTNNMTPANTLTEGNSTGNQFILTLQNPSSTNTTVTYSITGTAQAGSDFNAITTTAVIPQGSTVWPISVTLLEDNIVENTESIILSLSPTTSNGAISPIGGFNDVATNFILDNEGTASVAVSASPITVTEGAPAAFSLSLSQPVAAPTTITYNLVGSSSLSPTDYSGITLGTGLTTVLGMNTQTATVGFNTVDDNLLESAESLSLVITGISSSVTSVAVGSPATASVVINDNDSADLAIVGLVNGNEAGLVSGLFRIQMTNPADTNTVVSYTISTSGATSGSDFVALPGSATILAGNQFVDIPVSILQDATVEGTESLILKMVSFTGDPEIEIVPNFNDEASISILDDDSATVSVVSSSLTVGETGGNAVVTLSLSNPAVVPIQVAFAVTGNDATAGSDFTVPTTLTASFAASSTLATVTVAITDDSMVEDTETFNVALTSVASGPATLGGGLSTTVSITDNDNNVPVSITGLGPVNEGQGLVYQVSLAKAADEATTIHFSVGGGTAGTLDYAAPSSTSVVVSASQTIATVTINTIDDTVVEGDETLAVTLTSVTGALAGSYTLGGGSSATETILDGDAMTATASASVANASEAGPVNGVFQISLSGSSDKARTVHYSFGGSASLGVDYTAPASVVVPAGSSIAQVTVAVVNDLVNENTESVVLSLTSVSTDSDASLSLATLSGPATVTIADDDVPFVSVGLSTVSVSEGGTAVVNFTLDKPANEAFTLSYSLGGSTNLGNDFTSILPGTNSVTFNVGSTLATATISVADDSVVEGTETLAINLTGITGVTTLPAAIGTPSSATLSITDNDQAFVTVVKTSDAQDTAVGPVANGVFWINLTAPSQTPTVISYSIGGTASSNDYSPLSGLVTIPAGQTDAFVTVATVDDTIVESNETVIMTLNTITSGNSAIQLSTSNQSATITIVDSDVASITVGTPSATVAEGASASFRISLSQPVDAPTTVTLTNLPAGTATAGTDYTGLGSSTVVTIPAMSTSVDVAISASNDTLAEGNETVLVNLSGTPSFAGRVSVGGSNSATLTINDTDTLVVEGVVINNGAVQRSRLTSISVDLNGVVNAGQESLFEVRHRGNNTLVPLANMSFAYDYSANPGKTRVNITFTGSGTNVQFGSLADGNYDLTVKGTLVNAASQTLGSDYVFGNQASHNFFRLFGDLNGNRRVTNSELNQMVFAFQNIVYNASLDFNNNGVMNSSDVNQMVFRFQNYALVDFPFA